MARSPHSMIWCTIFVLSFVGLGVARSYEILIKTRETFKLADLQLLTARQHGEVVERVVLDARTGASLLRFQKDPITLCDSHFVSEMDWKGRILASGNSAEALVSSVAKVSRNWDLERPWTLRYLIMTAAAAAESQDITSQSLLCAVSQSIQRPRASLTRDQNVDQLVLVRVLPNATSTEFYYLVQTQTIAIGKEQSETRLHWSKRPFQYSSAIHYEIAEMAIGMLLQRLVEPAKLLDPTCGSGSFLAVAMSLGIKHLQGRDSNPICVQGSQDNLERLFGAARVKRECELVVHDSSKPFQVESKFNCMCCNLPWGENTKAFFGEDLQILSQVRHQLKDTAPCAVVWRVPVTKDLEKLGTVLKDIGYQAIGHAFVPSAGFQLPPSKKAKGASNQTQTGRSQCLVSLLETIETKTSR